MPIKQFASATLNLEHLRTRKLLMETSLDSSGFRFHQFRITRIPSPINLSMPWPHGTYRTSSTHKPHRRTYGLRTRASSPSPAPGVKPLGTELSVWRPLPSGTLSHLHQPWILLNLPRRDTCSHRLLAAGLFVLLSVHLCSYKAASGLLKGAT